MDTKNPCGILLMNVGCSLRQPACVFNCADVAAYAISYGCTVGLMQSAKRVASDRVRDGEIDPGLTAGDSNW